MGSIFRVKASLPETAEEPFAPVQARFRADHRIILVGGLGPLGAHALSRGTHSTKEAHHSRPGICKHHWNIQVVHAD